MSLTLPADPLASEDEDQEPELAALDYTKIPYIPRKWQGPDPVGSVAVYASAGGMGKGYQQAAYAARVVLGLPFPGENQSLRRAPGQVVWISGPGEDDQFEDLAPRLRAAIAVAVEAFGLDPALGGEKGAIRFIRDLSTWLDDSPVTLPADCPRVLAEIRKVNKLAEKRGDPPVTRVVADSLSAVLSPGYTIDSRQGAVKVMVKLGLFARRADVAFPVLHHLTKDGKVAGSAGVLNSVRLAYVVEPAKDDETVRVVSRYKSNITEALPLRYLITGASPMTHAAFLDAGDARAERLKAAGDQEDDTALPGAGSLRARVAAAAAAGQFRVIRRQGDHGDPQELPGSPCPTREDARERARQDAGRALDWHAAPKAPGMEVAWYDHVSGARVGYVVGPASAEKSALESS
jgi:hypothetical protein